MIKLTGFKNNEFVLNDDQIEKIEEIQDSTTITLVNGNKYIVTETADDIIQKIIEFRSRIISDKVKRNYV